MTDEEIRQVEHIVNTKIRANIPLKEYRNIPIEEAKELGAIALFGESTATVYVSFSSVLPLNSAVVRT